MKPFDFIILFFSFVFTLGLTHLLQAVTRMLRNRHQLVFSLPHGLWMLVAIINLLVNWISFWDFHELHELTIGTISAGMIMVVVCYFFCASVSPDFERGEGYDMHEFHREQHVIYVGSLLLLVVVSLLTNYLAGASLGIENWSSQNIVVLGLLPSPILALIVKRNWAQVLAPLYALAGEVLFALLYYPKLVE